MPFAHAGFRSGQRQLAETVYRAALNRRCLVAEAPTGIGKTIGTLFPLLKAVPHTGLDKVFYLTAKTSGRELALQALDRQAGHGERDAVDAVHAWSPSRSKRRSPAWSRS